MSLVKRTYVDQETVITAENLNAIQDAIIENEEAIEDQGEDIGNLQDAVGDGALDPDFTATNLTGAANELKNDVSDVRNTLSHKADVIYDTASGGIASFPDGADGFPVKDLTVAIEPVQDLHGYDNPWPAGGGKNLLQITALTGTNNDVNYTVNKDNDGNIISVVANGTPGGTNNSVFLLGTIPAGTYILSGSTGGSASKYYLLTSGGEAYSYNGDSSPFTISSEKEVYIRVVNGFTASNVVFQPMVRLATVSDATFAPYSNICPISGWTGCNVTRTGFNVWNEQWELGYWATDGSKSDSSNRIRCKNPIPVLPDTVYYKNISTGNYGLIYLDENKTGIGNNWTGAGTFTTPAKCRYVVFSVDGTTYNHDISINYPSTDHDYHPGTGNVTLPISWQSEAGTVYAASLDALAGSLKVRPYYASYNGETLVGPWISSMDAYTPGGTPTTGAQVVDLGGSETLYSIDSIALNTLLGQNNIFADCGPSTVEYPADTKLYIDKKLAALVAALS